MIKARSIMMFLAFSTLTLFFSVTSTIHSLATPSCYGQPNDVVMFETSWCSWCRQARIFFYNNNVSFTPYDIERNPRARQYLVNLTGSAAVPVIIACNEIINGFSEAQLRYHLELR